MAHFLGPGEAAARGLPHFALVTQALKPTTAPKLWRMNGIGPAMLGSFTDPRTAPSYFSMLWLTVLFVPVAPLGIYLVTFDGLRSYRFHGRISAADFTKLYPGRTLPLAFSAIGHGVAAFVVLIGAVTTIALLFHYRR
jgi:hypothetical protein